MAIHGDGADAAHDSTQRNGLEKSQPDHGSLHETAADEILVAAGDRLIEAGNALVQLCADAADQPVAETGQLSEREGGAVLCPAGRLSPEAQHPGPHAQRVSSRVGPQFAVRLSQWEQHHGGFPHGS